MKTCFCDARDRVVRELSANKCLPLKFSARDCMESEGQRTAVLVNHNKQEDGDITVVDFVSSVAINNTHRRGKNYTAFYNVIKTYAFAHVRSDFSTERTDIKLPKTYAELRERTFLQCGIEAVVFHVEDRVTRKNDIGTLGQRVDKHNYAEWVCAILIQENKSVYIVAHATLNPPACPTCCQTNYVSAAHTHWPRESCIREISGVISANDTPTTAEARRLMQDVIDTREQVQKHLLYPDGNYPTTTPRLIATSLATHRKIAKLPYVWDRVYLQQNFEFERVELNELIQYHNQSTKKRGRDQHSATSVTTPPKKK